MSQSALKAFLSHFKFQPERNGCIGIERERFLFANGALQPRSAEFLHRIGKPAWTYELSACQVEDRTQPSESLQLIKLNLLSNDSDGWWAVMAIGCELVACEVGPADMSLDVYPDQRYLEIVRAISVERLQAACRVAGTHIHIGTRNIEHALDVYHALREQLTTLCELGDHSNGERLALYRAMAIDWQPPRYENIEHFFGTARVGGFDLNLRNCWHLIRITPHGTVECRMFGMTPHVDETLEWVTRVRSISNGKG